jgi:hypothetical protein
VRNDGEQVCVMMVVFQGRWLVDWRRQALERGSGSRRDISFLCLWNISRIFYSA